MLTTTPAVAAPLDSPLWLARDTAMPPATTPKSASTGAPMLSTAPTTGTIEKSIPAIMKKKAAPPRHSDATATAHDTPLGKRPFPASPCSRRLAPCRALGRVLTCASLHGVSHSLVVHELWVLVVVGSNPATPTEGPTRATPL